MVIWITGLSASGKSTLCQALARLVKATLPELVLLDGDAVRAAFGADLGYGEEDRVVQIKRLQALAKILSDQGLAVIVGALYAHPDLLAWNRANLKGYFEVHLDAPLDFVRARDPKGLYDKAIAGETADVVGVDIPWHAPARSDMVVDATQEEPAEATARRIVEAVPRLADLLLVASS